MDEEDIAEIVSRWTGVPVTKLLEGEMQKLLHLEEELHRRVIGQDEAVTAVAEAVIRARSGLKDPNRPIGSFIFLGPTGVGKTELARALAEFLFDDEHAMIRIDMSEYQEKHTVARLVGAPPGYVGYEEGGQLTEAVRRRPYSVVLFDEIEKAHHDVFNVMLQILDDGRLTDGQGRTVDFKNVIVIMTSNIGSARILEYRGDFGGAGYERMKEAVMEEMEHHFRPEFLNRVDEMIVFHSLSEEHLKRIVEIQLDAVRARLADRHIALQLTDAARENLVATGYDPHYGARPLKRAIQKKVETPLGRLLLQGAVERRPDRGRGGRWQERRSAVRTPNPWRRDRHRLFQHREELADASLVGLGAILADFEGFVVLRGVALLGAVPLQERRANRGIDLARPGALQPCFALGRVLGDLRQPAVHPGKPLVKLGNVRIQRIDFGIDHGIDGDRDIGPKGIGALKVVLIVEEDGVLAQRRELRAPAREPRPYRRRPEPGRRCSDGRGGSRWGGGRGRCPHSTCGSAG